MVRASGKFTTEDVMEKLSVNDLIIKETADLLKNMEEHQNGVRKK